MASRIHELRELLGALIAAAWGPAAPNEVVKVYRYDVYAKELQGRKVVIFPDAYTTSPVTRGEDVGDYGFQIWIVERYEPAGDPTDEWVAERIAFAEQLANWVGRVRTPPLLEGAPDAYPQEANVTTIYDTVELWENKLFVSVVSLLLREDADAE